MVGSLAQQRSLQQSANKLSSTEDPSFTSRPEYADCVTNSHWSEGGWKGGVLSGYKNEGVGGKGVQKLDN